MKKIVLKVLNWIACFGVSAGTGYLLGKIASWLLTKIGVNEEFAEAHPWRTFILILLAWILIVVAPGLLLVNKVINPISNWIDDKIDDMDDDPFEE